MSFSIASEYLPFIQLSLRKKFTPADMLYEYAFELCLSLYRNPKQRITLLSENFKEDCTIRSLEALMIRLFPNARLFPDQKFPYYIASFLILTEGTSTDLLLNNDVGLKKVPFGKYKGIQFKYTPDLWRQEVLGWKNSTAVYPIDSKRELELMQELTTMADAEAWVNARDSFVNNLSILTSYLL